MGLLMANFNILFFFVFFTTQQRYSSFTGLLADTKYCQWNIIRSGSNKFKMN